MLEDEIKVSIEKQLLSEYVYNQQSSYMAGLYQYDEGLAKAVTSNFRDKEWSFNAGDNEWCNERINVTFKASNPNSTSTALL